MAGTKTGTWIRGIAGMTALRQLSKMSGNKKLPLKRRLLLAGLVFAAGRMQEKMAADRNWRAEQEIDADRKPAVGAAIKGKKRIRGRGSRSHPLLTAAKVTYKVLDNF